MEQDGGKKHAAGGGGPPVPHGSGRSWSCASAFRAAAEHTQKEVADMIGISQSYISRLEKRIIKRLKGDLERIS